MRIRRFWRLATQLFTELSLGIYFEQLLTPVLVTTTSVIILSSFSQPSELGDEDTGSKQDYQYRHSNLYPQDKGISLDKINRSVNGDDNHVDEPGDSQGYQ